MEGLLTVNAKEMRRATVLQHAIDKQMTLVDAAALLGVSYRQAKRLKERFARDGLAGLVHRNRHRVPVNAISEEHRQEILTLHSERYTLFNDTHFTEMLNEREGVVVSRETVRKLRRQAGYQAKRRRRPPRHRSRRPRRELPGMLLQWDGSPHRWFGPLAPPCCLMAAVDDADNTLLGALFVPAENSLAYLRLLAMVLTRHGLPLAVYHDRHSALVRTDPHWSLEEQLQGYQYPTHVGRVLAELGIESIPAYSPQAKGRVENRFALLQDRLIAEMSLEGLASLEEANAWLRTTFIDRYNQRFRKPAASPETAFVPITAETIHQSVCFAYEATVGNDNTVRLGGIIIDIPPSPHHAGYARKRVFVKQHLDGTWSVWHQRQRIATAPATELIEPVRSWKRRNPANKEKSILQTYIASKPALPSRGHFPFALRGTD
jgi:transposase